MHNKKILTEKSIYEHIGLKGLEEFYNHLSLKKLEDLPIILETIPKDTSILELGSGNGRISSALIKNYGKFLGIEINKEYYKYCIKKFGKKYFQKMDVFDIKKLNKTFGGIVAPWTFFWGFNRKKQEKLLGIIFDILDEKGICMIESSKIENTGTIDAEYNRKILRGYPLTSEDYIQIGKKKGFKNFQVKNYTLSKPNQKRNWTILKK